MHLHLNRHFFSIVLFSSEEIVLFSFISQLWYVKVDRWSTLIKIPVNLLSILLVFYILTWYRLACWSTDPDCENRICFLGPSITSIYQININIYSTVMPRLWSVDCMLFKSCCPSTCIYCYYFKVSLFLGFLIEKNVITLLSVCSKFIKCCFWKSSFAIMFLIVIVFLL